MSMFGPKPGSWWVFSRTDPRWNGNGDCLVLVSGGIPKQVTEHIERLKLKLGNPPDDLEYGVEKD